MKTADLARQLLQHDQDLYVVLRDADSSLIHSLQFLIEETAVINGHQDYRCGPHNLTYPPHKGSGILLFGQQTWPSAHQYPDTPDVQTVGKLAAHLAGRNPDLLAVVTHYFDDFVDIDVLQTIDDAGLPVLWGNPGSNVRAWPPDCQQHLPEQVLLLSNSLNEAYCQLRRTHRAELEARTLMLESKKPHYQGAREVPRGDRNVISVAQLEDNHARAALELTEAQDHFARAIQAPRNPAPSG